ncbi:MAG: Putative 3-methyladenine DNA glycosylase [Desulfotomaculum sp. 46_296]|nr:MAG: Putative 3-methyladenine DNA glycosylase [Desulfotomaculum sp. 46_296]HAU32135.1 DNA-3-methyladenine glycosylase [Desulfotomaculum sp.]
MKKKFAEEIKIISAPIDRVLPVSFYDRDTRIVASELLGHILVNSNSEGMTSGIIVETEAYLQNDPACHAARGMTKRNRAMFGPPGCAYIYFIYGMYYCFNVVTREQGVGEAVLIRALEPIGGIELMKKRRGRDKLTELCRGPGRLVQAMGIDKNQNGQDLTGNELFVCAADEGGHNIVNTTRVGISEGKELPLRFYIAGNPNVSKR